MGIAVLLIIIIILLIAILRKKPEPVNYVINKIEFGSVVTESKEEWEGRPVTASEQEIIDNNMAVFIENNPNAGFFKQHPEYIDKYLENIDLSELNVPLTPDE